MFLDPKPAIVDNPFPNSFQGLKYFAKNLVLDLQWFQWGCIDEKLNLGSDVTLVCGGNQAVYR